MELRHGIGAMPRLTQSPVLPGEGDEAGREVVDERQRVGQVWIADDLCRLAGDRAREYQVACLRLARMRTVEVRRTADRRAQLADSVRVHESRRHLRACVGVWTDGLVWQVLANRPLDRAGGGEGVSVGQARTRRRRPLDCSA